MALLSERRKGILAPDNLLPLFVIISLAIGSLNLALVFLLGFNVARVASKPVPTLVQTIGGESILTEPMDHLDRAPETIRTFVQQTLTMMFTWNAGAAEQEITDQGVEVGDAVTTTKSWQASFALSEDFRASFLEEVGRMTPRDVFAGQAQSVLNIESLSEPRSLGAGQWEIEVVANLIIFSRQSPQGIAVPFNKKIYLRAVEPPSDPLAEEASGIQRAIYQIRSSGLQMTEMHELSQ